MLLNDRIDTAVLAEANDHDLLTERILHVFVRVLKVSISCNHGEHFDFSTIGCRQRQL